MMRALEFGARLYVAASLVAVVAIVAVAFIPLFVITAAILGPVLCLKKSTWAG